MKELDWVQVRIWGRAKLWASVNLKLPRHPRSQPGIPPHFFPSTSLLSNARLVFARLLTVESRSTASVDYLTLNLLLYICPWQWTDPSFARLYSRLATWTPYPISEVVRTTREGDTPCPFISASAPI